MNELLELLYDRFDMPLPAAAIGLEREDYHRQLINGRKKQRESWFCGSWMPKI